MYMNNTPIVITSIFPDSKAIKKFIVQKHPLIIVADKKTPILSNKPYYHFFSVEKQIKKYGKLAEKIPFNQYCRKNLGYLEAMKISDTIMETDDDNFPYDLYPNFILHKKKVLFLKSSTGFLNIYKFMSRGKNIWPRGYPLQLILTQEKITERKKTDSFPLQQSLIDNDTDVDAIYRLTINKTITFAKNKAIALEKGTYSPFNSQNTFWSKEVFLCMYLPCYVTNRTLDIFRAYIAQRMLWEINKNILFTSSSVYQERNPHNYLRDFVDEIPVYTEIEKLTTALNSVKLSGSFENKLIQIYTKLISENILVKQELELLNLWIKQVSQILEDK
jgi:hypothetical protein